jgi:hypothetical protein
MYRWIHSSVSASLATALVVSMVASRVQADTVCGSVDASWNVPAGAVVFSRSPGPVRDVIDAAGESRSHSMLSHGPGGSASHATMVTPGQNGYSSPFSGFCETPLKTSALRDGYPGASVISAGGVYTYLYHDGPGPEFVYYQQGDPDGSNPGNTVQSFLWSDAPAEEVSSQGDSGQTLWLFQNTAQTSRMNYSLYQFRDLERVNLGEDAWNDGVVCSTFLAWSQARSGVNIEQPISYPNEVIARAARQLHDSVQSECSSAIGFWGKIEATLTCPLSDVCSRAANQVVNCMTSGDCGNTGDGWKRIISDPSTGATSISPDCVGGWNACPRSPAPGASIWSYDDNHLVQWNADGTQYGCWD